MATSVHSAGPCFHRNMYTGLPEIKLLLSRQTKWHDSGVTSFFPILAQMVSRRKSGHGRTSHSNPCNRCSVLIPKSFAGYGGRLPNQRTLNLEKSRGVIWSVIAADCFATRDCPVTAFGCHPRLATGAGGAALHACTAHMCSCEGHPEQPQ